MKCVDDNLQINKVNMETVVAGIDPCGTRYRDKHGIECQNIYRRTIGRAEECGMKVNGAKTTMLCVSGAQSDQARAHIRGRDGEEVRSGPSMKALWYHLSSKPGAHAHVKALEKRMKGNTRSSTTFGRQGSPSRSWRRCTGPACFPRPTTAKWFIIQL